jgi:small GTP-binding protein
MRDDKIGTTPIRYQIWDLAGQQRFDAVREVYYKGCVGALLVYDVTRPDSYFNTPKWINELWGNNGRGRVPIVVVANKIDMRELSDDTVSPEQGRVFTNRLTDLTKSEGFECNYIETSAKTGVNIQAAFGLLGTNVMRFVESQRKTSRTTSRLRAVPQRSIQEQRQF